jgi:hypothetical protein
MRLSRFRPRFSVRRLMVAEALLKARELAGMTTAEFSDAYLLPVILGRYQELIEAANRRIAEDG